METAFFKNKTVCLDQLEPFGFAKKDGLYYYRQAILEGQLLVDLVVDEAGRVTGKVVDVDTDEEYSVFRVPTATGQFVGQVREAYGQLLENLAQSCFRDSFFQSQQANRIIQQLKSTYGDEPDFPFDKSQTACFRVPANQKWYALLFPLNRRKLDSEATDEEVEVLNLKVDSKELPMLLEREGIFPAYHMAKGSWISLVLDDSQPDDVVLDLVFQSRALVAPKGYQKEGQVDYWIIPANPKYYDIAAEFAASSQILWTQKAAIKAGDRVVIYMTAPERCLRYLCQVLEADMVNDGYRDRQDIKKLMRLDLLATFTDHDFPIERLESLGVKSVRGPRRVTKALYDALTTFEANSGKGEVR